MRYVAGSDELVCGNEIKGINFGNPLVNRSSDLCLSTPKISNYSLFGT
jgi:hypothetical protein